MPNVFISHASNNAWVIDELTKLITKANPEAKVFCTSSDDEVVNPIDPGDNYKEAIFAGLRDADVFVAVISHEYWKSRYCIMELGAAYERHCFDEQKSLSIQPLLLPPLSKGLAFANTPLKEMQLTSMINPRAFTRFLNKLADPGSGIHIEKDDPDVARYTSLVKKRVLKQASLTASAEADAFFDERPENQVPRDQVARCRIMEDESFLFEFHLSRPPYTPDFASIALKYWDEVNFREYLKFDRDAAFCFDLDNAGGVLRSVVVEFKVGETHQVFRAVDCPLAEGVNSLSIPLSAMDKKPLGKINQICFVIHPNAMNGFDGKAIIGNLRVAFAERNILEEVRGD